MSAYVPRFFALFALFLNLKRIVLISINTLYFADFIFLRFGEFLALYFYGLGEFLALMNF